MSESTIHGLDHLADKGAIVIPNRLPAGPLQALERALAGRRLLWLVAEGATHEAREAAHLRRPGVEAIAFGKGPEAVGQLRESVARHLEAGGVAVFVPGQATARLGTLFPSDGRALDPLLMLGLPVVPAYCDLPRLEMMTIERASDHPEFRLHLGPPLHPPGLTRSHLLQEMMGLWAEAFEARPILRSSLGWALLQGMKKHGAKAAIIDGVDGSRLTYDRVLAVSLALAFKIREWTSQPRVGIVLPPGRAGLIANLATLLAGKVPVNLNYTAAQDVVHSTIRQADLDKFITVDAFVRRMQRFPWPPNRQLVFLERELPGLKASIARWFVLGKVLPAAVIAGRLGLPRSAAEDEEAVLLFTSGSADEPKGVPLTHRNVLANTAQFAARLNLAPRSSLLGCLPLFHSFGCTVTLWYPVIEGLDLVTFPSPLEVEKLAGLVHQHGVTLMVTTPTFLRGFLRKARREQFARVELIVTGAEKLPVALANTFEQRFGKKVLEGYGLTETSPVTNFNLPNLEAGAGDPPVVASHRLGSVGQLVPGLAVRVSDPSTDEILPPDSSGVIWFKGANVFGGYLHWGARNREVIQEGWFRTGDIGRLDDDGFLYIEGRLSRFSKIGGEMVSHERVEEYIVKVLGLDGEETRRLAVVGVPDPAKGEALVLLSTTAGEYLEQEMVDLRYRLLEMNVPALWIPRKMVKVPEIPTLASGKLDLRACEAIARQFGRE